MVRYLPPDPSLICRNSEDRILYRFPDRKLTLTELTEFLKSQFHSEFQLIAIDSFEVYLVSSSGLKARYSFLMNTLFVSNDAEKIGWVDPIDYYLF